MSLPMTRSSDLVESMAIAGAVACLAHCIALPLVVAALPAIAAVVPVPTSLHIMLLGFAVPTTALALWSGFQHHRRRGPVLAGTVGLVLLAAGALLFGEGPDEVPVTVAGSLLIAGAHLANWRLRRHEAPHHA